MSGIYRTLDSTTKEIRLLLLKAGQAEHLICCEVRYTSFLGPHILPYETISYVWGDASIRGSVVVDNCELDVPASSESVLRRLRLPAHDRLVWLDAVCVNQGDPEERNHQVAMMADIYSGAVRNLVWLGGGDRDPETSVAAVRQVFEDARRSTDDFRCFLDTVFDVPEDSWRYATKGFPIDIDFEAIKRFFARPWFGRLWVVQEAALAPVNTCYYGDIELSLLDVLRVAVWLLFKGPFLPFRPAHELGIRRAARIWNFTDRDQGVFSKGGMGAPKLFQLLSNLQLFQASEPRDHVYGLLGLYQKFHGGALPTALYPDYERPLPDILRAATKLAIDEQQVLDCFNFLPELSLGEGRAASWMPRWHLLPDGRQHPGSFNFGVYNACGRHMQHRTAGDGNDDEDVLVTEGIAIDKISRIVMSPEQETGPEAYVQALNEITEALASQDDASSADCEALIALTLIAEKDYRFEIVDAEAALETFTSWKNYIYSTNILPPRVKNVRNQIRDPPAELLKAAEYMEAFYNACRARSIFLTEHGRLGVGMKRIAPDDVVAVLWGCTLPVVLRPLANAFEHAMVCVSYVSGVMHGETVEKHEAAGHAAGLFFLR